MGRNRNKKQDRHQKRQQRGADQLADDRRRKEFDNDWNLNWFQPSGQQIFIGDSFNEHTFTIVDAPSGCGKTTMALWLALNALKDNKYEKVIFLKNPTEVGDDQIGYLSGGENDKLLAHYETTKEIFKEFMSPPKLENDINSGKIKLKIPNFSLGATWDYSIVIFDETQLGSPNTVKLILERCGQDTKYFILGDSRQRYSIKKRPDGFRDFIEKVTAVDNDFRYSIFDNVGYVRMTTDENKRSEGSKFITKLYEGDI